MSNIQRYSGGLPAVYQPGLNGFFGDLWDGVKKKAGKWAGQLVKSAGKWLGNMVRTWIPVVGDIAADALEKQTGIWADRIEQEVTTLTMFNKGVVITLTSAEEAKLNTWVESNFKPYLKKLVEEVATAMKLGTPEAKIAAINVVINKINAINDHYSVATEAGLSEKAIGERQVVVIALLQGVHDTVVTAVQTLGLGLELIKVNVGAGQYSFSPLFTTPAISVINSDNYKIVAKQTIGGGSTPGTTIPTNNTPTGNNAGKYVLPLLVLGGGLVVASAFSSKKKKKK